jgi:hypothetical protein
MAQKIKSLRICNNSKRKHKPLNLQQSLTKTVA